MRETYTITCLFFAQVQPLRIVTRIAYYLEKFILIWWLRDGGRCNMPFKLIMGIFTRLIKHKIHFLG